MPQFRPPLLTPAQAIALGFLAMILAGSLILSMPFCAASGRVAYIDALFTATSAVCVTGLVTVDTATTYSAAGQAVILMLVQLGGLGYMTSSALLILLTGRPVTLRGRLLLREAHGQYTLQGMVKLTRYVLTFTLIVESIGVLLLSLRFALLPKFGGLQAVKYGAFHAISAFCNAGFDLMGAIYGKFSSFTPFVADVPINLILTTLIIVGGIGFPVALDLTTWRKHRLSLHTRVVLIATALLILIGTVVIAAAEWENPDTLGKLPWPVRLMASYFQAITPRTAGFNTIEVAHLHGSTLFFIGILMFIGASPAGTGGGIKTTTAALILAAVAAVLHNRQEAEMLGRRIPTELVYRALAIVALAALWVNLALLALTFTEVRVLEAAGITCDVFAKLFFEVLSAFGTVGLSTGITPHLSVIGRIVIVVTMYVGRVGPLTAALAFLQQTPKARRTLPEERILIG
ncbi:MAG: TrkH family potassium uptake protein [Armatimonadota bacterium]